MALSRYSSRVIALNNDEKHRALFKDRGVNFIRQYTTPILKHPSEVDMQDIEEIGKIWAVGDRYWKLAAQYYGYGEYWFIIAWWNQKPIEGDVSLGDTVYVPFPLERVLRALGI